MATNADIFRFRARFPELEDASDADIAQSLDEADVWLDASVWSTRDFPTARLLWAAHTLQLGQIQQAASSAGGSGSADLFTRTVRFGERMVSFGERKNGDGAEAMAGPGESLLSTTTYGQKFLQLRARNIFPILTV